MKHLLYLIIALLLVAGGISIGYYNRPPQRTETHVDTIHVYDTMYVRVPVPYDSAVIRYIRVPVPYEVGKSDSLPTDTLQPDSIDLPITQKVYQDSSYTAYVSGFNPQLDSLILYRRQQTIIRNHTIYKNIKEKPRQWGVSLQGGYGITPKGLLPYLGVGFYYRIW